MGQAGVDLPDPLDTRPHPGRPGTDRGGAGAPGGRADPTPGGDADDLLSQLAGEEIDRLLAEADVGPQSPPAAHPPANRRTTDPANNRAGAAPVQPDERGPRRPTPAAAPHPAPPTLSPGAHNVTVPAADETDPAVQAELDDAFDQLAGPDLVPESLSPDGDVVAPPESAAPVPTRPDDTAGQFEPPPGEPMGELLEQLTAVRAEVEAEVRAEAAAHAEAQRRSANAPAAGEHYGTTGHAFAHPTPDAGETAGPSRHDAPPRAPALLVEDPDEPAPAPGAPLLPASLLPASLLPEMPPDDEHSGAGRDFATSPAERAALDFSDDAPEPASAETPAQYDASEGEPHGSANDAGVFPPGDEDDPDTARAALPVRLLEWVSAPLAVVPDPVRQAVGKVAILTLINAVLVLLYVLLVRRR